MTTEVTTLKNGLRVVSDVMPHIETATVGIWVDAGARHEDIARNGISHMLEHMAFKGTKSRSARDIAEEIEAVGGYLNAYTSREQTTYYARVMKEDVPLGMDILSDILQHSVFDPVEVARERDVILQEIGQANDTPDDLVFDIWQEAAFPDQPLGRSILGTPERVSHFSSEDIRGYMETHYRAPNMVVAAAGNISHKALVTLAEDFFGDLGGDATPGHEVAVYRGGEHRIERDLEQVHLVAGFDGVAYEDPDYYAAQVFSTLMGGGMSSRLFQEIREVRGLAYSIYAFSSSFVDTGSFGIYAGTSAGQANELLQVTAEELKKVIYNISPEEADRARTQIRAGLLMSLESSSSRMEQLGRQLIIFGRPIPVAEMIERVREVDIVALQRFGERLLSAGPATLAAVGPLGALDTYERIGGHFVL
jgi:predicted Zn-dependent peptidase